jgi:hypothetical protein
MFAKSAPIWAKNELRLQHSIRRDWAMDGIDMRRPKGPHAAPHTILGKYALASRL